MHSFLFHPLRCSALACTWVFLALVTVGCGSKTETLKIKDYRLALVEKTLSLETEFSRLVRDFNREARIAVLTFTEDASKANSAIVLTRGLKEKTNGKIGLGQWIAQSESDVAFSLHQQNTRQETIHYSMRLEFDAAYITSRLGNDDPVKRYENQKLFFHEVGHGLEMDHNPNDMRDVMYPDVAGDKDFEVFFDRVRAYMRDNT